MRMRLFLVLAALVAAPFSALASGIPLGELPNTARPTAYRVALTIDPGKADFSGTTEIDIETSAPLTEMFLHGNGLVVSRAEALTGRMAPNKARYEQLNTTGVASLRFARPLPPGRHVLRFSHKAPFRTSTSGLYKAEVAGRPYAWTQFQAIDARRVFPAFDEPRHKAPFTISITAPDGMKAFANAPEAGTDRLPGKQLRHRFETTGPMPTYLVALAVGDFDVVDGSIPPNAVRKEALPFRAIATKGQAARLGTTMAQTPAILTIIEDWFGTPYPFPKLDVIASPIHGGAMENSGLIVFDDTLLLLGEDAPPSQLRSFGIVMAHELAHMWFGNAVTPRWWDDIWLNESFAEWMGNETAAKWRPDLGVGIGQVQGALYAMNLDSLAEGRPIRQPITDNADINSAFDGITYSKGGQVIRMMGGYLGEERFQRGVRRHLERHWNGTATSDDFFANMAASAGDPRLVPAFRSFVDQRGVPLVRFGTAPGGAYSLSQERFRPIGVPDFPEQRWLIPVCAASGEGRQCAFLENSTGALAPIIGTAPWVTGNANGAGYYRFDLPPADWDRLLAAGAALPAAEALTAADSLWAGFTAGNGSFARVLAGARAFARHEDRIVSPFLAGRIIAFAGTAGSNADQAAAARFARDLAAPKLAALGLNPARGAYAAEAADRRQLRQIWAAYAVIEGRAEPESARLADAARKALAGDADALDPLFRTTAFRAALRADPKLAGPLFEALAASDDPLFRRQAASALGAEGGPALLDRTADTRLQNLEALGMISAQLANPEARTEALGWLERNLDALRPRLGGLLGGFVDSTAVFCSEADAARVDALFRPRLEALSIGALDLDRPLARIRLCAALKAERGAEASAALTALN